MLRRTLAIIISTALASCANAPHETGAGTAAQATSERLEMRGGYSPVVRIPVDDPHTKFVTGAYFKPEGNGPFPAVIILGGCRGVGGPHDLAVVKSVNSEYLPRGIATLVIDSLTPRGVEAVCDAATAVATVAYRAEDAYAAMAWLDSRPEIDAKQIFLQGYSHGAMSAIEAIQPARTAAHSQKFAGVVAYYPYCAPSSKFTVPTIILVGAPDAWVPASLCRGYRDKSVDVTIYPKAPHGFAAPGLNEVYQGRLEAYDEAATKDALSRALALIESLPKPAPLPEAAAPTVTIIPSSEHAERPNIKAGDRWVFAERADWGKLMNWQRTWVITSVDQGGIVGEENGKPLALTLDLNVIESPREKQTNLRSLDFPLEVGKKWTYEDDYIYFNDPNFGRINGHFKIDVVVAAYERVKVSAGQFDAFKLDARGTWVSPQGGPGELHSLYWYAPAAHAVVKAEHQSTYMPNTTSELLEFKLQP